MTALRVTLAPTPTPAELKAAREAKGLDLDYIAARIALHASTLRSIEDGELKAMDPILWTWASVIEAAPERRSLWRKVERNPWTTLLLAMFAAAVGVLVAVACFHVIGR